MTSLFHFNIINHQADHWIVFLHGFLGSSDEWQSIIDSLGSRANYVCIDLPGHKEAPLYSSVLPLSDVVDALDQELNVRGIESPIFVGYSMGGRLALAYHHRYPHKTCPLFLIGAHPGYDSDEDKRIAKQQRLDRCHALRTLSHTDFLAQWNAQPLFGSSKVNPSSMDVESLVHIQETFALDKQPFYSETLRQFPTDIRFFSGEFDAKYTNVGQKLDKLGDHVIHRVVKGADHRVHYCCPDVIGDALVTYLNNVNER